MKWTDIPLAVETALDYTRYRLGPANRVLQAVNRVTGGRQRLSDTERHFALRADAGLRRLGVRCLGRAVVVARMLQRRGVAASVSLSVSAGDPRCAHAEPAVGGHTLHPHPDGYVTFR